MITTSVTIQEYVPGSIDSPGTVNNKEESIELPEKEEGSE